MIRNRLGTVVVVVVTGGGVGVVSESGSSVAFLVEGLSGLAKSMETIERDGDVVAQGKTRKFDGALPHKGHKVTRSFPSTVKAVVGEEASD